MVSALLSRFVILTAGTLYPAYRSYKAVRTKDVREYVKWMMYWIVFALFCFAETLADVLIAFWFPFYYETKMIFVIWLLSPWTKGASILYRKWVHPTLAKHERGIDALLDQAKNEGYNTVLKLGSQGLIAAREIVTTAAVKGQLQLVQQIQRSVSLNDVTDGGVHPRQRIRIEQIHEENDDGRYADQERVWQGAYDDAGRLVEEEFRYLDEQGDDGLTDDAPQAPRRSTRMRPSASADRFATMPRATVTRGVKKRPDLQ